MHAFSVPDGLRGSAVTGNGEPGLGGATLALVSETASPARPSVSLTPAARGYPGGIVDAFGPMDDAMFGEADAARQQLRSETDDRPDVPTGLDQAAVWRRSLAAWQDAGLDWQPQTAPPADRDWSTEPIPVVIPDEPVTPVPEVVSAAAEPATPPDVRATAPAEPATAPAEPATPPAEPASTVTGRATAGTGGQAAVTGAARKSRRLTVLAAVICGVVVAGAVAGIAATHSGHTAPSLAFGLVGPYPPARLADAQLVAPQAGPLDAVHVSLAGVATAGSTVVAVGSQPGLPAARPVILFSADGGRTWQRASLAAAVPPAVALPAPVVPAPAVPASALPAPAVPAPVVPAPVVPASALPASGGDTGATPVIAAGGDGRWLALGARVGWVSADGRNWRPVPGLPVGDSGDEVAALARTSGGFLAVGQNVQRVAGHEARSPVLWSTPDGVTWRRVSGSALRLGASARQVLDLRSVAAHGRFTVIAGDVVGTRVGRRGQRRIRVQAESPALWRSNDGGATWHRVNLPARRGAGSGLVGVAATRSGFVAVRPGRNLHHRRDAVVFVSTKGSAWRPVTRLIAGRRAPLRAISVAGSDQGVAVTGVIRGHRRAFLSATGNRWFRAPDLGGSYGRPLAGVTVGPGRTLIVAGMDSRRPFLPTDARPFLLLAGHRARQVGQAVLAGTAAADVVVNGLASGGGQSIAVGSARGEPAVWLAGLHQRGTAGSPAAGSPAGPSIGVTWRRPEISVPHSWDSGGAGLTSAARGSAGWLAAGSSEGFGRMALPASAPTAGQASPQPVVMMSVNGNSWRPAPAAGPLLAPGVTLAQVAAGPSGYVVVGSHWAAGRQAAAAWHSASLTSWVPAGGTGQGASGQGASGQGASGQGASGQGASGQGTAGPGHPNAPSPSQMLAVTAANSGFVAAGYAANSPAVWASPDGSAWRLTALPVPAGAASAALTAVTAHGSRVVATGTATSAARTQAFAAVSADGGRTWRESLLPLPSETGTGSAGHPQGAPARSPATAFTATAFTTTSFTTTSFATTSFATTALTAVTVGFVAAGVTDTPGGQDVLVWWSQDGLAWHSAAPAASLLRGPGAHEITALGASGHTLTAFGYVATLAGQHPITWQARVH